MTARDIEVAGLSIRALRISYVGELGWELHCPMSQLPDLYRAIVVAGGPQGVVDFGTYAMNSLRMEKAYKAWGTELTTEISPLEADIMHFVRTSGGYISAEAVARKRDLSIELKLVYCEVETIDADPLGDEPVYVGDKIIGVTTSGAYGHCVNKSLVFLYVENAYARSEQTFDIEIQGERRLARILDKPVWDPDNKRLRA
jgi:dimethylglycine dehydrogenase